MSLSPGHPSLTQSCIWVVSLMPTSFPSGSGGKESAYNVGNQGSIPGSGRSSGGGNGNPVQYSCPENPMDRKAWWATVHGVAKSQKGLTELIPSLSDAVSCSSYSCSSYLCPEPAQPLHPPHHSSAFLPLSPASPDAPEGQEQP